MSPDPVSGTALHLINPQRWNMYAYVLNNPLFYTDPDGRDAIVVGLSQQVRLLGIPFGHAGIISVHRGGTAQYGRLGPRSHGWFIGPNSVTTQPLPNVQFGPDGVPTQSSYRELAQAVAKIEQQDPSTINFAYYKTSEADTAALDGFLSAKQEASDQRKLVWYFGIGNNCADFCINALSTAHVVGPEQAANASFIPNVLFWELSFRAASVSTGETRKTPSVTETICYEGSGGCQAVK